VSHGEYADGTDRQTDRRQTVTLGFPLDAANVTSSAVAEEPRDVLCQLKSSAQLYE